MKDVRINYGTGSIYSPDRLFEVLEDTERYPQWWPDHLELHLRRTQTGEEFPLRIGRLKTVMQVGVSGDTGGMRLDFSKGQIRGEIRWRFEPADRGALISLDARLRFTGPTGGLIGLLYNIDNRFSREVRTLLHSLENEVLRRGESSTA